MTEMLSFMAAPFAACLVLVGLHAYFGIHVIERRILFVDLAVATADPRVIEKDMGVRISPEHHRQIVQHDRSLRCPGSHGDEFDFHRSSTCTVSYAINNP